MSLLVPSQLVRSNQTESYLPNSSDDTSDQRLDIFAPSSEYAGDRIDEKKEGIIRIGVVNIHGIPKTTAHPKNINIYENITTYSFDIMGLAEVNCYWPSMPDDNKWNERDSGGVKAKQPMPTTNTLYFQISINQEDPCVLP